MNNYEILAFKDKCSSRILKKSTNGYFADKSLTIQSTLLLRNTRFWEIYSVRRLSDNVVFTIGDEIIPVIDAKYTGGSLHENKFSKNLASVWDFKDYIILNFKFVENKLCIFFISETRPTINPFGQELDVIKPLNKPVMEEEFVLPTHWYIKTNLENIEVVSKWFIENKQNDVSDYGNLQACNTKPVYEMLCFPGITNISGHIRHGVNELIENNPHYVEITFEQFKKYVLKEDSKVEENFVLPEFWKIKRNLRTNKEIGAYFDELNKITRYSNDSLYIIESYPYLRNFPLGSHYLIESNTGFNAKYVEISLEQFKKYVLKQNDNLDLNEKSLSLNDVLNVWSELSGNTCESIQEKSTLFKKLTEFVEEQKLA